MSTFLLSTKIKGRVLSDPWVEKRGRRTKVKTGRGVISVGRGRHPSLHVPSIRPLDFVRSVVRFGCSYRHPW